MRYHKRAHECDSNGNISGCKRRKSYDENSNIRTASDITRLEEERKIDLAVWATEARYVEFWTCYSMRNFREILAYYNTSVTRCDCLPCGMCRSTHPGMDDVVGPYAVNTKCRFLPHLTQIAAECKVTYESLSGDHKISSLKAEAIASIAKHLELTDAYFLTHDLLEMVADYFCSRRIYCFDLDEEQQLPKSDKHFVLLPRMDWLSFHFGSELLLKPDPWSDDMCQAYKSFFETVQRKANDFQGPSGESDAE